MPFRDRDVYEAIAGTLKATGVFERVVVIAPSNHYEFASDITPVCVITPKSWSHKVDGNACTRLRVVSYELKIIVNTDAPDDAYSQINRLEAVTLNAIEGSTNGGLTLPEYSIVSGGKLNLLGHPEYSCSSIGQFGYTWTTGTGLLTSV